jgi:hypothetical protein
MPETVNVPVAGKVKKPWLLVGGGAIVALVAYFWWQGQGATVTEPESATEVPEEGLPAGPGSVSSGGGEVDSGLEFITSDTQWRDAVRDKLIDSGWDPILIDLAIGKWFLGQTLTSEQAELIEAAIGAQGYPPSGEKPIKRQDTQPSPTPGSSVPSAPASLNVTKITNSRWALSWPAVSGASSYELRSITGHTGDIIRSTKANAYIANVSQTGGHLAFEVRAVNSAGVSSWTRKTVVGK